ncbi:MAG: hypothetical protein H5T92_08570 [Synergistales bacterium]|nr:hypothetical protein [Synergistales bacterium]
MVFFFPIQRSGQEYERGGIVFHKETVVEWKIHVQESRRLWGRGWKILFQWGRLERHVFGQSRRFVVGQHGKERHDASEHGWINGIPQQPLAIRFAGRKEFRYIAGGTKGH